MKTNPGIRRGFTLVELLVVISIIATLAGIGVPVIISKIKDGARAEAIGNVKQVGLALFTFDQEYGTYPSDATALEVEKNNPGSGYTFGSTSSNDLFRQLLAANTIDSEKSFYAKAPYTKKPDAALKAQALEKGECGFGYVMASSTTPLSSAGNSGRPLVVAALNDAKNDGTFDPDVYNKKAVVLRIDNSATAESINLKDKKIYITTSKTLLDPGADDTVWEDIAQPIVVPPSKK